MRRFPALLICTGLAFPALAHASPFAVHRLAPPSLPDKNPGDASAPETQRPAGQEPTTTQPETQPGGIDYSPTSSKAPDSGDAPEPQPEPEPEAQPQPETPPADMTDPTEEEALSLDEEREKVKKEQAEFNRHGVGARGGITIIPTWLLNSWLTTHTNSLCRGGNIGGFAEDRGLLKQDGCNFYVGGEYTYRQSRILDIVGAIGYQHAHAPDGYWLDNSEWADSCDSHNGMDCNLAAADYTEVDLGLVFIQADFVARYPIVITEELEFGLGGGAGLGLGIVIGGVYQTPLGANPGSYDGSPSPNTATCTRLEDLEDHTRCTPRWDAEEAGGSPQPSEMDLSLSPDPNPLLFAQCNKDTCNSGDLRTFGYRKEQDDIPPVIPVVNLILSARLIVKDVWGIVLNGGFNTGFYFGGSMQYFFGKDLGKNKKGGPAAEGTSPTTSRVAPKRAGFRF